MIWIILGVLIGFLLVALILTTIAVRKGKKHKTDYYALFIMGIFWFPFGLIMSITNKEYFLGNVFLVIGLVYIILGLTHKKEWKKNRKTWNNLNKKEKIVKGLIVGLLILGVLVGLVFYIVFRR